MSALSDIVASIESSGGANVASQPASMVNPTYGQYGQFVTQYGSGAAGVDNYASQVLAANPNATLGDFYSGYALNTGNPANTPGLDALQSQYPSYYNNLVNNAGVDVNTPLSQLVGPTSTAQDAINGVPLDSSSSLAAGPSSYVDPNNINALDQTSSDGIPSSVTVTPENPAFTSGANSAACTATSAIMGTLGIGSSGCSVGQAITTAFTALIQGVESWFTRGFLIVIGLVLAIVALFFLLGGGGKALKTAALAAA